MRVRAVLRSVAAAAGAPPDGRHQERIRIPLIATLLTGVAVGLLFDAATLGLRHLTGAPSFPENVSDLVVPYIPADTFGRLLSDLGPHGKEILVVGSLLGAGLAVVGLAAVYGALVSRDWRPLRLGVTLWLLATLALWILLGPVLDANDAGGTLLERRVIGILSLATCVAVATSAAALMFAVLSRSSATAVSSTALTPARGSLSRRSLLASVAGVSGGLVLGGGGLGAALQSFRGATNLDYEGHGLAVEALTPITATKDHYVVSKNLVDPSVDAARWRLEVKGLVASPVTLTLGELAGLTQHEEIVTLECIANGAGGTLMSTARWAGPRLADVVARAGAIHPAARFAVVSAVDGYYDSLTHDEAMARSTLVALRMNGQPLPDRHGYPARLVVPGRYGEKAMKWLTAIELSRNDYTGFYQREGWSEAGVVRTFSRINAPTPGSRLPVGTQVAVTGLAFAGTRGVSRVELSDDGGTTWGQAELEAEISPYAWRFWRWRWTPGVAGRHTLTVRAVDGTGAVQTKDDYGITPAGASAWHSVSVFAVL